MGASFVRATQCNANNLASIPLKFGIAQGLAKVRAGEGFEGLDHLGVNRVMNNAGDHDARITTLRRQTS